MVLSGNVVLAGAGFLGSNRLALLLFPDFPEWMHAAASQIWVDVPVMKKM